MNEASDLINNAVDVVLKNGFKTKDLIGDDNKNLSTQKMGDEISNQISKMVNQ